MVLRDTWPTSWVLFLVETVANDELSRTRLQQHNPPSLVQHGLDRPVPWVEEQLHIHSHSSHHSGHHNNRHSRGRRRSLPDSHHTRSSHNHNLTRAIRNVVSNGGSHLYSSNKIDKYSRILIARSINNTLKFKNIKKHISFEKNFFN